MMSGFETGQSVQVVSVESNGRYLVNEEAVRRLVHREDVRGLPVAVVSVAGATRGGKSFLLDFFLRYLHASEAARADGSWIGADDEPLRGFSWRGGSERDTTGILLWSEPIIMKRDSGEEIVVLLMDTQGTFDTQTTFLESTTIFALSSLMSSVQIYNLSQNIKEDDLEYLQFFTEYGKMVSEDDEKPFQVLQFILRDWSYPYQHPYGNVGGQALLDVRLDENNCKEDMREVRQQIKCNFESVRCFLMPHPGLIVASNPNFKGCITDISTEFKQSLLELVPSLLDCNNLTVKHINSQIVKTEDFLEYLKTYVTVFNSDELPTPVSILKATGEASLEVCVSSARGRYAASMRRECERCVPRAAVPRLHAAALAAARELFADRRLLVSPARAQQRLDDLIQELNDSLLVYICQNENKHREAIDVCTALYEKLTDTYYLRCLTDKELEEIHKKALSDALEHYDTLCQPSEEDSGEDRRALEEKLESRLPHLNINNVIKIKEEVEVSKVKYERGVCGAASAAGVCTPPATLAARHRRARLDAAQYFDNCFTSPEHVHNEHRNDLLKWIEQRWSEIEKINTINNQKAVQTAIDFYNATMEAYFENDMCLHPIHLKIENRKVSTLTFMKLDENRTEVGDDFDNDCYKTQLQQLMNSNWSQYHDKNVVQNEKAVELSHGLYKLKMNISDSFFTNAVNTFIETNFEVFNHNRVKEEVLNFFHAHRHPTQDRYSKDIYLEKLTSKIQTTLMWLVLQMTGQTGVSFLNLGVLGAMIFKK